MALLFVDSFDHYLGNDPPEMALKYDSIIFGGGLDVEPAAAKNGPNGLNMTHTAAFSKNCFGASGVVIGWHNKFESLAGITGLHSVVRFREGSTTHVLVQFDFATSTFKAFRGGTLIAQGSSALPDRTDWHYLELKCIIADAGGLIEMRIDGAQHFTFTGDTRDGALGALDNVMWDSNGQAITTKYLDDITMCSLDGGVNDDYLGPTRVLARHPDADGNYSQLLNTAGTSINNYTYVDDVDPDGDASYVESGTPGDKDSYGFQPLALDPGESVLGLQVVNYARKTDTDPISVRSFERIAAADYPNTDHALSESYGYFLDQLDTSPATAVAWTEAEVDAAEFGIEVRA